MVSELASLRFDRDEKAQKIRSRLLQRPMDFTGLGSKKLLILHDLLLFEVAHQESGKIRRYAENRLGDIYRFVELKTRNKPDFLLGSGVAGTQNVDSFSLDLMKVMDRSFSNRVDLDWKEDGSCGSELDDFILECLLTTERDALLFEECSTKALFSKLLVKATRSTFSWLIEQCDSLRIPPQIKDRVINSVEIWIRWNLAKKTWSRTFLRFPKRNLSGSKFPIKAKLSRKVSSMLLDICRGTLASRGKETDTVTYSDPSRVKLYYLEHGVDIALFELNPDRRLPIESYIGFVASRNRVPIAYGGAWIFGYRAEVGINVFDEFRGGDSRGLFEGILSVYQREYGATTFLVHPSQFGGDNEEAISSGAFWFYYRIGFRPDDEDLCRLAEKEADKRKLNRKYRSSRRILKRLSEKQLILVRGAKNQTLDKALVTQEIGYLLLCEIGKRFNGDKKKALRYVGKIWKNLEGLSSAPPDISLILYLLPNLGKWTLKERRELKFSLNLKDGASERPFVRAIQKHVRLREELVNSLRVLGNRKAL